MLKAVLKWKDSRSLFTFYLNDQVYFKSLVKEFLELSHPHDQLLDLFISNICSISQSPLQTSWPLTTTHFTVQVFVGPECLWCSKFPQIFKSSHVFLTHHSKTHEQTIRPMSHIHFQLLYLFMILSCSVSKISDFIRSNVPHQWNWMLLGGKSHNHKDWCRSTDEAY